MQNPHMSLKPPPIKNRSKNIFMPWLLAIGPGVLGLTADNDAGGMLSYFLTGAYHHLLWFLAGLFVMAPVTYLIQELALRVAIATRLPYGRLLSLKFGRGITRLNGVVLYGLNGVILVTEFLGMASALQLLGLPWTLGVTLSLGLVLFVTSVQRYGRLERVLLWIAGLNLIFIPIVFMLPLPVGGVWAVMGGGLTPTIAFLLLALAGNAIAPWMIYWQQNAVWAGNISSLAAGRKDIRLGVAAQVLMAAIVLTIGALAGIGRQWQNPLQALAFSHGATIADFFALGIFNAGFLAACTISLSSAWMVRDVWHADASPRDASPTSGSLRLLHGATVTAAALVTLWPHISIGAVALWAQALGALWMPVSLLLLAILAADGHLMGLMAIRIRRRLLMGAAIMFFLGLGVWTFVS